MQSQYEWGVTMIEMKVCDDGIAIAVKGRCKDIKTELAIGVHEVIEKIALQTGQDFDRVFTDFFVTLIATNAAYAKEKTVENAQTAGEGSA